MIFATLLFLPPEWPRRVLSRISQKSRLHKQLRVHNQHNSSGTFQLSSRQRTILVLLTVFFIIQLAVPLRHFFYPGEASWTEEGQKFSWRMMLEHKDFMMKFYATDPINNKTWNVNPNDLTYFQLKVMPKHPDMILQYSHHIADELQQQDLGKVEVRAEVMVSLNGRERQLLIDPGVNLAAQQRTLFGYPWILPLET